ncbi:MAG: NusG domain II-containing protein [Clostridia bacterium]|nr:NusG domain II-containing protein [Clostridia bacterium]
MKKGDVILSAVCVILAVLVFVFFTLSKSDGDRVIISVDGKTFGEYSLSKDREIPVESQRGQNTVVIKNNKVTVTAADCPDKYCVSHVGIDETGETIVCLPHRLTVEIKR